MLLPDCVHTLIAKWLRAEDLSNYSIVVQKEWLIQSAPLPDFDRMVEFKCESIRVWKDHRLLSTYKRNVLSELLNGRLKGIVQKHKKTGQRSGER